jgi:hypothetical protein
MAYGAAPGYPSSVSDINGVIAAYSGTVAGLTAGNVSSLGNLADNLKMIELVFNFSGFGGVIPVNQTMDMPNPANGTIVGYQMGSRDSGGSATVKLWKKASGTQLPTVSDVISTNGFTFSTASATLFRSGDVSDLTTTAVAPYDQIAATITAASVLTAMTFTLYILRT